MLHPAIMLERLPYKISRLLDEHDRATRDIKRLEDAGEDTEDKPIQRILRRKQRLLDRSIGDIARAIVLAEGVNKRNDGREEEVFRIYNNGRARNGMADDGEFITGDPLRIINYYIERMSDRIAVQLALFLNGKQSTDDDFADQEELFIHVSSGKYDYLAAPARHTLRAIVEVKARKLKEESTDLYARMYFSMTGLVPSNDAVARVRKAATPAKQPTQIRKTLPVLPSKTNGATLPVPPASPAKPTQAPMQHPVVVQPPPLASAPATPAVTNGSKPTIN